MQLYFWRGAHRNFGDELNTLLWPRLLPGFFDDDPSVLFVGIGSVLDARHDPAPMKLVAGAGYGGYQPLPVLDARWVIHWVRGPRTARQLGLPANLALGDPAMLFDSPQRTGSQTIGFMPHFESLDTGAWAEAAAAASITLLDPRDDPATLLAAIAGCRLVISEAMHGIIVADALRVPWVAVRPQMPVHRAKWQDWAEVLDLQVRFQPLASSSLPERLRISHVGRRVLAAAHGALDHAARGWFVERAAHSLAAAAAAPTQLSSAVALDRCRARMLERCAALLRAPLRPANAS